jgi:hypothetical protein
MDPNSVHTVTPADNPASFEGFGDISAGQTYPPPQPFR